jgi:hypothetical protein
MRFTRVGAEFALCLALPKEVPALVELLLKLLATFGCVLTARGQRVFFGNQRRDASEQVVIGHERASYERVVCLTYEAV